MLHASERSPTEHAAAAAATAATKKGPRVRPVLLLRCYCGGLLHWLCAPSTAPQANDTRRPSPLHSRL